jgi:hypothetical protein
MRWRKRAKVEIRNGFRRRVWSTPDGPYRVVESRCLYGGQDRYGTVYYSLVLRGNGWDIISRHRKRVRALKACERHAVGRGQLLLFKLN